MAIAQIFVPVFFFAHQLHSLVKLLKNTHKKRLPLWTLGIPNNHLECVQFVLHRTNFYLQLEFLYKVALLWTWLSRDEFFFICILCHTIVKMNCCYCEMDFN